MKLLLVLICIGILVYIAIKNQKEEKAAQAIEDAKPMELKIAEWNQYVKRAYDNIGEFLKVHMIESIHNEHPMITLKCIDGYGVFIDSMHIDVVSNYFHFLRNDRKCGFVCHHDDEHFYSIEKEFEYDEHDDLIIPIKVHHRGKDKPTFTMQFRVFADIHRSDGRLYTKVEHDYPFIDDATYNSLIID